MKELAAKVLAKAAKEGTKITVPTRKRQPVYIARRGDFDDEDPPPPPAQYKSHWR